jgi:hypothetical protein
MRIIPNNPSNTKDLAGCEGLFHSDFLLRTPEELAARPESRPVSEHYLMTGPHTPGSKPATAGFGIIRMRA